MDEEKIREQVTEKFGALESDQLELVVAKVAKQATTDEEATEQVEALTTSQIAQSYADYRVNKALRKAERSADKEEKKAVSGHNDVEAKEVPSAEGDDTPAWAKALIESNRTLQEQVRELKGDKVRTEREKALGAILEKLPEPIRKAYGRTNVEALDDEAFEELKAEVKSEAEAILKTVTPSGAVFGRPSVSFDGTAAREGAEKVSQEEQDRFLQQLNLGGGKGKE